MPDRFQLSPNRPRFRLRSSVGQRAGSGTAVPFAEAMEEVVQQTLRLCARHRSEGIRDLESSTFVAAITSVLQKYQSATKQRQLPVELKLFSKPFGLFEFRLHNRRYVSIAKEVPGTRVDEPALLPCLQQRDLRRMLEAVSSESEVLTGEPKNAELLDTLFRHLNAVGTTSALEEDEDTAQAEALNFRSVESIHEARLAALLNWQQRKEAAQTLALRRGQTAGFHCYPFVEAEFVDNAYLALFIVSPLDLNFVDEKVPEEHRVAEITLALYHVRDQLFPGIQETLLPLMKQAFGRVLFTNMMEQNSQALTASFGELGTISRYWVTAASEGIRRLLPEDRWKAPFDAFTFCEAIVEKVLCARIPGVTQMEVYPFNQAFMFREAGVRGVSAGEGSVRQQADDDEPVEMYVLQASILSKKPADRGRYLTRRERVLRETQDFECDASQKKIKPDDKLHFFIHGHPQGLILSRKARLTEGEKEEACSRSQSRDASQADNSAYYIGRPAPSRDSKLSQALYNLFGRLFDEAIDTEEVLIRQIDSPKPRKITTQVFKKDFERARLRILQEYDKDGLFFHYSHGLDLAKEAPLLKGLQEAFFEYRDDKLQVHQEQFIREKLEEKGVKQEDIEADLRGFCEERRHRDRRRQRHEQSEDGDSGKDRSQQTKVVYISFSSRLHEENMQLLLSDDEMGENDAASRSALLGPEYTYTIVLVADQDPEKSQAQLQAERNDLKLYFYMLMRQIWMEKLNEHRHLAQKSRCISKSLGQFLHRAKGLLAEKEKRRELDSLRTELEGLITPGRAQISSLDVSGAEPFLATLLAPSGNGEEEKTSLQQMLLAQADQWFPGKFGRAGGPTIEVVPSHLPELRISWSAAVAHDAFYVALKNACEALLNTSGSEGSVRIRVEAVARDWLRKRRRWYVEVVVENPGGPIDKERLAELNARTPQAVERNEEKAGSTGVGVFLARYQLQDMIGDGADLLIINAGSGIVQTRLRLPAESLVDQQAAAETQPLEMPLGEYILYVEDDRTHHQPTMRLLEPLASKLDLDVCHRRSLEGAKDVIQKRMPRAVISDLTIPPREHGGPAAAKKCGRSFLTALIVRAHELGVAPPVWIVTAEDEKDVRSLLEKSLLSPYHFIDVAGASAEDLTGEGVMCICGVKQICDLDNFSEMLEQLAPAASRRVDLPVSSVPVVTVDLGGDDFSDRLGKAVQTHDASAEPVFVVTSRAEGLEKLAEDLHTWFTHPGIEDLDPDSDGKDYPLNEHVTHSRLVLAVSVERALFDRLPVRFLYWGLSNNLWLTPGARDPAEVARHWLAVPNEERGPLAKLRHDLVNGWFNRVPVSLQESVKAAIKSWEDHFPFPKALGPSLEATIADRSKAAVVLKKVLNGPNQVTEQRRHAHEHFVGLETQLHGATMTDASTEATVAKQRAMLRLLDNYLQGES